MISEKDIKDMGFETIEDVYNSIVKSRINGLHEQTRELVKKLSSVQHTNFVIWLRDENIEFEDIYLE
jgi:hypothetical protein